LDSLTLASRARYTAARLDRKVPAAERIAPLEFEPLDQYRQRRKKLSEIESLGHPAYPHRFASTHTPDQIAEQFGQRTAAQLDEEHTSVRVAGRVVALRPHGKAAFAHLAGNGERLQIYVKLDTVGEADFRLFQLLDLGDIIGVSGPLFRTKTNELTVRVEKLQLLTKALLPLPEKWHGLADVETRYRRRYLDLIVGKSAREIFLRRAQIIRELRHFFDDRGYVEVETPMMHPILGGATARPFVTHHNRFDMDLYLRVAPELYLKRLVVGGLDRVYEMNRNFRNEGIDAIHQPEFTMLEFYQAYSDAGALMDLTEELLRKLARKICGSEKIRYGETKLDFSRFQRLSMVQAIAQYWPPSAGRAPTADECKSRAALLAVLRKARDAVRGRHDLAPVATNPPLSAPSDLAAVFSEIVSMAENGNEPAGKIVGELFEALAEPYLIQPTLIYEFPIEISPLAKKCEGDPALAERFELFVAGMEIANGFSELNDPVDQEQRFRAQVDAGGQDAPKQVDTDYLRALSYGLPPTAGEGIGVDRLVMLLTDSHAIREVILFPLLRAEASEVGDAVASTDTGEPVNPPSPKKSK
jgi:lysyl-tRNA synthetase, class II